MAIEVSTTPGVINYTHRKGDTWQPETVTVYDGGTIVNGVLVGGTPRNFTGYTGRMQIRTVLSNDIIITLTTSGGITLSSLGVITLTMTAAETAAIAAGDYVYDMQTTSGAGVIKTWFEGSFTIVTDVTQNS